MAAAPSPVPSDQTININDARRQVMTSDFFALCYLMLCQLGYTDENDGTRAVAQIAKFLPKMPVPEGTVAGAWRVGWGPQATGDNSNLLYAAELMAMNETPVFSAIVIRGTDTQAKPAGLVKQLFEDLATGTQVDYPQGNTAGAKIALGTKAGLDILARLRDPNSPSGRTILTYAADFVRNNPGAPIVVTGHSLGGCQTTVLAMLLSSVVPAEMIVPISFAAPSAGNAAFIALFEKAFQPRCRRWFNDIDLVPMAFAGVGDIAQLWNRCQRPAPAAIRLAAGFLQFLKLIYSQQSAETSIKLSGVCQPATRPDPSAAPIQEAVDELQQQIRNIVAPHFSDLVARTLTFENITDWVKELLFQHLILTGYWEAVKDSQNVAPIPNPFPLATAAGV
jgi:triacylglycerol lipase